ncbi:FUSC family protein [Myxococcus sp. K15C18031901]|uniref:FUSC family protein n=1 Tax=Myxococcus dinghuensis TaxID=2906761 RepID=UPI0020A79FFE|nr:FUSC family protein [Myxococcus dinghuensis]MCP3097994.1 FUSC family protein [Myxococcus dinghuensis]
MSAPESSPLGLDRARVAHALRLALAAWLAFVIAVLLHVPNPYWAAMPVWVVAQPSRGLMLERGFYRVVGTLLGAGLGLAILHAVDNPYLQLLGLGGVVALGAGLTHVLRGVQSYGAMMAGMTAAIVVLPSLFAPSHSLELALARIACTLIGVLVVTLVTGLFTPEARREDFYGRVQKLASEAVTFAARSLAPLAPKALEDVERRILVELSDVDASSSLVSAGSIEGYRRLRHVEALVAASLSVMAAAKAVQARVRRGEAPPPELAATLATLAERLATGARQALSSRLAEAGEGPELTRLRQSVQELADAERALFGGHAPGGERPPGDARALALAPHRDWSLARRTALVAGLATLVAGSLGTASGLAPVGLGALGICIFCIVLGSMAMPQKVAPLLFLGVCTGVLFATLYRFLIQPHLTTPLALALSVLPFLLLGAVARTAARTALPAIDGNMCFLLASQAGMPAAGASAILGGGAALVLAAGLVSAGFVFLPRDSERQARGAALRVRDELERLLTRGSAANLQAWQADTARQLLRLLQHLGRAGQLGREGLDGLLATLNLGDAITRLRTLATSAALAPGPRHATEEALRTLARLAREPERVAAELSALVAHTEAGPARRAIEAATDALAESQGLLTSTGLTAKPGPRALARA